MTKDLANIAEVKRALDDINADIEKHRRYEAHFTDTNVFERDALSALKNTISRELTTRHALERKLQEYENS
jgi:hypothetical protein